MQGRRSCTEYSVYSSKRNLFGKLPKIVYMAKQTAAAAIWLGRYFENVKSASVSSTRYWKDGGERDRSEIYAKIIGGAHVGEHVSIAFMVKITSTAQEATDKINRCCGRELECKAIQNNLLKIQDLQRERRVSNGEQRVQTKSGRKVAAPTNEPVCGSMFRPQCKRSHQW